MKRGDMVMVFDPVRPTGSGTGFRGLAFVDEPGELEVKVRPLTTPHVYIRIARSAVHAVFAATDVAEEMFR